MGAFCHLLVALLCAAQEPAAGEEQADPVEVAAFAALRALEAALPPAPAEPDERALAEWSDGRIARLLSFTVEHTGTEASAEAWHAIGLLRLQSEIDPTPGLTAMGRAWEVLRGLEGPRPGEARLSPEGYGEYLLAMLLDHEALDRAALVLAELREGLAAERAVGGGPDAALRRRLELEEGRLASLRALQPGRVFPALRFETLDGAGLLDLAELRGAPLLLEFHPPAAGPASGAVAAVAAEHPGLQVLTVYVGDAEERPLARRRAGEELASSGWMPGGLSGEQARQLALRSLPRGFLLDGEGRIHARDLRGAALGAALAALQAQ